MSMPYWISLVSKSDTSLGHKCWMLGSDKQKKLLKARVKCSFNLVKDWKEKRNLLLQNAKLYLFMSNNQLMLTFTLAKFCTHDLIKHWITYFKMKVLSTLESSILKCRRHACRLTQRLKNNLTLSVYVSFPILWNPEGFLALT